MHASSGRYSIEITALGCRVFFVSFERLLEGEQVVELLARYLLCDHLQGHLLLLLNLIEFDRINSVFKEKYES